MGLTDENRKILNERMNKISSRNTLENFIDIFARNLPSLFAVIHYTRFSEAMKRFMKYLEQKDVVEPRV